MEDHPFDKSNGSRPKKNRGTNLFPSLVNKVVLAPFLNGFSLLLLVYPNSLVIFIIFWSFFFQNFSCFGGEIRLSSLSAFPIRSSELFSHFAIVFSNYFRFISRLNSSTEILLSRLFISNFPPASPSKNPLPPFDSSTHTQKTEDRQLEHKGLALFFSLPGFHSHITHLRE